MPELMLGDTCMVTVTLCIEALLVREGQVMDGQVMGQSTLAHSFGNFWNPVTYDTQECSVREDTFG